MGFFNTGVDTVNLHRPTRVGASASPIFPATDTTSSTAAHTCRSRVSPRAGGAASGCPLLSCRPDSDGDDGVGGAGALIAVSIDVRALPPAPAPTPPRCALGARVGVTRRASCARGMAGRGFARCSSTGKLKNNPKP